MKLLMTLLALVSSFTVAAAAPKMCPAGTKEVLSCVSQSSIPLYPFVSTCGTQSGESLIVMSVGAGRSPDIMKADKVESESTIIYTATEEDTDNLTLTYIKGEVGPKKTNGVLTYKIFMGEFEDDFHCKISQ
ncbi:hypothetical protein SHI21_03920 [Bacteriovorax sp. PP10]|uniref:Uncharacterized protein n=1 Tax=Bacteriovorax antarcticus TaxID=3088717 RepID=A0ABU5VQL1_9BACT|nr:hypothetical protein [Bacteriovorax sp. PP10]MEA9355330.1 hypothetical protein [Bacteriovorax sp. PP10]